MDRRTSHEWEKMSEMNKHWRGTKCLRGKESVRGTCVRGTEQKVSQRNSCLKWSEDVGKKHEVLERNKRCRREIEVVRMEQKVPEKKMRFRSNLGLNLSDIFSMSDKNRRCWREQEVSETNMHERYTRRVGEGLDLSEEVTMMNRKCCRWWIGVKRCRWGVNDGKEISKDLQEVLLNKI